MENFIFLRSDGCAKMKAYQNACLQAAFPRPFTKIHYYHRRIYNPVKHLRWSFLLLQQQLKETFKKDGTLP